MDSKNKKLESFIRKRKQFDYIDYLQAFLLAFAIIAFIPLPVVGTLLLATTAILNLKKLVNLSNIPCPRCNEKFGKINLFSNFSSLTKCQNCNLQINNDKEFSIPLIVTLAIVVGFMGGILIYLSVFIKLNNYGLFLGISFIVGAIILLFLIQKSIKT